MGEESEGEPGAAIIVVKLHKLDQMPVPPVLSAFARQKYMVFPERPETGVDVVAIPVWVNTVLAKKTSVETWIP